MLQASTPAFDALVREFSLSALSAREIRIRAFHSIRDIAYGDIGSRNPFDVLEKQKGTCSGKHALLKLLLQELGYEVQSFFALHDFSKFPLKVWPDELKAFQSKTLTDYHDFLKVSIDGRWVSVDAIFDASLAALGFPVTEWDGMTDVPLPIIAQEIFEANDDVEEHKKTLIASLPEQVQKDRKAFLKALTEWLDEKKK